jgi:cytochrome b561
MIVKKYNKIAIILHWLIAIAIIFQLASGMWMVDAIKSTNSKDLAYNFYQHHKSAGLLVLILSIFRLIWRFSHKPPKMPNSMSKLEVILANSVHITLYFFMIAVPLAGWCMISSSSYNIATMFFGLFEWPQISFLAEYANKAELNKIFSAAHAIMAKLMLLLLILHIFAALKHQFISKDKLINRILP